MIKRKMRSYPVFSERFLLLAFLGFTAALYAAISIISHYHYETFGWDLGFFDQIIWKASRGDLTAYSTMGHENLMADHFQAVLYFLAPLYLIKADVRMILIAQAFLVILPAYFLFIMSKSLTKNSVISWGIVVAYILFLGTQWTILNEFHQNAFVPLFLALVFYALHTRRVFWYWTGIIGLFITKEEMSLLVAALGLLLFFTTQFKKTGIFSFFAGFILFFLLIYKIMPFLSVHGAYSHNDFGEAGYTPLDVLKKSAADPAFFARQMVSPPVKLKTVHDSFFAFGYLPLIQPVYLIPVIEQFATRFIYAGPQYTKWANVNHHAAPLGILLGIGTLHSAVWIAGFKKFKKKKKMIYTSVGLYIIAVAFVQDLVLHGPVNSLFKRELYRTEPWMKDINKLVALVPKDVPVSAQNSVVPHLSQRTKMYLLPEIHDAEYILVDLHDGPNKYSPLTREETVTLTEKLTAEKSYSVYRREGDAILFKANGNAR